MTRRQHASHKVTAQDVEAVAQPMRSVEPRRHTLRSKTAFASLATWPAAPANIQLRCARAPRSFDRGEELLQVQEQDENAVLEFSRLPYTLVESSDRERFSISFQTETSNYHNSVSRATPNSIQLTRNSLLPGKIYFHVVFSSAS